MVVSLGMRLLPFRTLRRLLAGGIEAPTGLRRADHASAERAARAVHVASSHAPGFRPCFTKALTTKVLLARRGHLALLRIGVAKGEEELHTYAWAESGGKVMMGGHGIERYSLLAALEGERL